MINIVFAEEFSLFVCQRGFSGVQTELCACREHGVVSAWPLDRGNRPLSPSRKERFSIEERFSIKERFSITPLGRRRLLLLLATSLPLAPRMLATSPRGPRHTKADDRTVVGAEDSGAARGTATTSTAAAAVALAVAFAAACSAGSAVGL